MKKQNFENHIRFYTPHHFIYYPILIILIAASVYLAITTEDTIIFGFIASIFVLLFALGFMLRQHYALTLQNRIVRLELRYRYFTLTGSRFEPYELKLSEAQIFALRFAPDDELPKLVDSAVTQGSSATKIKNSIVNWRGDYERV